MKATKRRGGGTVCRSSSGIINSIMCSLSLSSLLLTSTTLMHQQTTVSALTEKEVLHHVYGNLNGDNWDKSWNIDSSDICSSTSYPGVTCNAESHVTEIDLSDNNLAGSISPYVYTLPYLKKLDMSKNRITSAGWDRINVILTNDTEKLITNIEIIDVTNNLINTVEGVTKLSDTLVGLHMTYNNLKGSMPSELFALKNLEILAISENELTGEIPSDIGMLTNLLEFYSYGNKLTGKIPSDIGLLTKMQILTFAENQLSGPLPEEIKNMGNLQTFSVHNNDPDTGAHTGQLPKFDTHPFLNEIYLDGNAFTGTIPHTFLKAFNASDDETVTIGLEQNKLTGTVPRELLKFDSLVLNIAGNQIEAFDSQICDSDNNGYEDVSGWMNGMVELFGCDAILCPVDYFSDTGKQEDEETPCQPCEAGTDGIMGATDCDDEVVVNNDDELAILVEFYLALGGTEWDEAGGWDTFQDMEDPADLTLASYQEMKIDPCDSFLGVICVDERVVEISLPNNGLEGLVPSSFFDLPNLEVIDLSGNEVRLSRDYGFGDIGNAKSLRKVDFSSNDIQSFKGIGAATNLEELVVDDAYFFSDLDDELFTLTDLKTLHMQFSGLKGTVPKDISKMTGLKALNLYGNELTGHIPTEIGLMTNLWHVDFSENDMTGHLPTVAIHKLLKLEKFHVHQSSRGGGGITGELPAFDRQPKLHMLDINSNKMNGTIPENFLSGVIDVDQLMEIDIGYNDFTGTVPGTLSRFTNMRFDATKNEITGVSSDLCSLTDWWNGEVGKVIDGGGNGCDAIMCPKGTFNDYGREQSGSSGECKSCPDGLYAGATTCAGISEESDNLEKQILHKLFVATGGKNWTKGKVSWKQGGAICNYEGITCDTEGDNVNKGVTEINLSGFGLKNSIPTDIYKLPSLEKVDFSNNVVDLDFDGIDKALYLEEILFNDADLKKLDYIYYAPALKKLHISRNSFPEGDIPDEIYNIETLESLAMSYNGFGGTISSDISTLKNLKEFWSSYNDITGSIPEEMGDLSQLESLVLTANRMSGEIPEVFEDIDTLKQLHLNGQRDFGGFTGPLPHFKQSMRLHDLDFSKNSLTGSIPSDFLEAVRKSGNHDIYAYDSINLASNQLTGTLPSDWDDFVGLFVDASGNRISGIPSVLCDDDDEFMDGMVGNLTENKCNAILCPPGTSSPVGRQADANSPCEPCSGATEEERTAQAPYYGMLSCESASGEKKILQQLYSLIFTGASEDSYWNSEQPICSWYGIICDDRSADSGVTGIKLEENALQADEDDLDEVSELFFSLPDLETLNLRGNDGLALNLANVGNPPYLTLLQLSATGLTSIAGIGQATKLKELHFTENNVAGTFPEEIFELTSMERLYMSFNDITGTLPTRIGELTDLREFYAYTNSMTGDLPTELGNLLEIENLVLGQNKFEGTLPTQLNKLVNLKEFSVYYNQEMTGQVLDFAGVTKLEKLDIEGNKFTGSLPSTFLSSLDIDYIADSDNEIILHLADNSLSGPLPMGLANIKNLYLDIVGNQFDELPGSFCQDEQSFWMNGQVGELEIGCHAIACPKNSFSESGRADADNKCQLCGLAETAPFVGSYACIQVSIEIEALKDLYKATDGDNWDENKHWMDYNTPICSWFGIECAGDSADNSTVTKINLPDNSLDGTMPHEIWDMPALQTLNLKENNVHMGFTNVGKAKKLEVLYISDIDIGNVDGIGKASALKELHITANEIKGEFPSEIFDLADTMERLYLAYNSFSGTLSTEFGKLTNLIDFYAYDNEFSGTIPSEFAELKNLQNFVVAENKLSGTIPDQFSYMPQLRLFSAYRRLKAGPKLTGELPSFSNSPNLEGLYLDFNHLAGTIPANFLKSSLNTKLITISHNYLTGEVPTDLMALDALNIEMEGNKITDFDERFCEEVTWMDGLVNDYGCDAFMCAPGYFSVYGRQNTTDSSCERCSLTGNDDEPSPYWGSTACEGVVDDKEILELLYSETKGDNWNNNEGWLKNDDICSWYGVKCSDGTSVESLHLGANNLVGTPPEELFHLSQLHTLWLHSNPINFKFRGIGKAKNLIDLRVDSTGLRDVWGVGEASHLVKLDLKFNQISGKFPNELLSLGNLKSLSLTDNSLTGAVPKSYGQLTKLTELRLGSNLFSGSLPTFEELEHLSQLDLSDNNLVGTIPRSFLSGIGLRDPIQVDLSSNSLSGTVPTDLDLLNQLTIYLRDNKFTGLPPTLCDSNNQGWNLREVELYGCDAIMCPPGTANFHGRQSSENIRCMSCPSNKKLYGQITCDGMPMLGSSGSRLLQGGVAILASISVFVMLLF